MLCSWGGGKKVIICVYVERVKGEGGIGVTLGRYTTLRRGRDPWGFNCKDVWYVAASTGLVLMLMCLRVALRLALPSAM